MNIMSFLLYCVVVTFTPGPSNIVILASVNQNGFKHALKFIAGSSLAFVLLIAASVTVNRELLTRIAGIARRTSNRRELVHPLPGL